MEYSKFLADRTKYMKASEIRELLKLAEQGNVISFAGGLPDPATFPKEKLSKIAAKVIEEQGNFALQYGPTLGVTQFRNILKQFMRRNNVKVNDNDDVIVTTGSQESLYLVSKVFVDPGDYILVEAPTYLAAINVFREFGAKFASAPIDENGMKIDILEKKAKKLLKEGAKIKLIYAIPTCQNPSGVTMNRERRKYLLELAEELDLLVIEDDPYSFFSFKPVDAEPLKTMDKNGRVIYMSTLSKILSPGMRIGWTLANSEVIKSLELAKQAIDLHTPNLTQYIAMEAIREGVIDEGIEKARKLYKEKRDIMLNALERYFPKDSSWTKPIGGLFIFAYLPEGIDTKKLLPEAVKRGVAYVPGQSFFAEGGGENTLRLNFSYPSKDLIEEGIKRLGEFFKKSLGR